MTRAPPDRPHRTAHTQALALLARRDHSVAELQDRLLRAGYPADEVTAALQALAERGWLDEERSAAALAGSMARARKLGPARIREALGHQRRLPPAAVEHALRTLGEEGVDWDERARAALRGRRVRPDDPRARERLIRFLQARGFDLDTALRAVRAHLAASDPAASEPADEG